MRVVLEWYWIFFERICLIRVLYWHRVCSKECYKINFQRANADYNFPCTVCAIYISIQALECFENERFYWNFSQVCWSSYWLVFHIVLTNEWVKNGRAFCKPVDFHLKSSTKKNLSSCQRFVLLFFFLIRKNFCQSSLGKCF